MRVPVTLSRRLLAAAAALATALPAFGQDIQRGINVTPDEDLVEELAPEAGIDKTMVLPGLPPETGGRGLRGSPVILLNGIAIDNGTILSGAEVDAAAASHVGRNVSVEDLEALRRQLSLLYFDKGYVNSGLLLPDQQVSDNVVHFREIRGELTAIQLSGNDKLSEAYIRKRIARFDDQPLEINALQTSLQLLEQDPMIDRINAQLLPGAMPGQGMLRLVVTESRPWQIAVRADNHRSPAVGGEQASLMLRHLSLTGHGDELQLYGSYANGYGDGFASYSLPLNSIGTSAQIYGSTSDSDIVEAPFEDIDIQSETGAYGLSFRQVLHRSLASSVAAFLGAEIKRSQNSLLGEPFSFTYGERDGEANVTVIYTGLEYARRFSRSVAALRGSVRRGIYRKGATENQKAFGVPNIGPDGQFTSLILQGQYIRSLEWRDASLIARMTVQHVWQPLLAMEKLPMGGASTVRGYRENSLVRDNGVIASLEYRVPLFEPDVTAGSFDARRLTLAVFADYGESWNEPWELDPDPAREDISSVGLGLLWNPAEEISASLYWGHALNDFGTGHGDLQDDGIHFSVSWTPWE